MTMQQVHLFTWLIVLTAGCEASCYYSYSYSYYYCYDYYDSYYSYYSISGGSIAFSVVGAIFGVGILIALVVCCRRRAQQNGRVIQTQPTNMAVVSRSQMNQGFVAGPSYAPSTSYVPGTDYARSSAYASGYFAPAVTNGPPSYPANYPSPGGAPAAPPPYVEAH